MEFEAHSESGKELYEFYLQMLVLAIFEGGCSSMVPREKGDRRGDICTLRSRGAVVRLHKSRVALLYKGECRESMGERTPVT